MQALRVTGKRKGEEGSCMYSVQCLQWNLSKLETLWKDECVLISHYTNMPFGTNLVSRNMCSSASKKVQYTSASRNGHSGI